MSHTNDTHAEHDGGAIAEIKKVTIILSVLTIVELILGFWMIGMESKVLGAWREGYHYNFNDGESILYCCLFHALKT